MKPRKIAMNKVLWQSKLWRKSLILRPGLVLDNQTISCTSYWTRVFSRMKRKDTVQTRLMLTTYVSLVFFTAVVRPTIKQLVCTVSYKKVASRSIISSQQKTRISSQFSIKYARLLHGSSSLLLIRWVVLTQYTVRVIVPSFKNRLKPCVRMSSSKKSLVQVLDLKMILGSILCQTSQAGASTLQKSAKSSLNWPNLKTSTITHLVSELIENEEERLQTKSLEKEIQPL